MRCPICDQEMNRYKEEACYSRSKQIEYKRSYYRCEQDDTWGRIEVPVGSIKVSQQEHASARVGQ